MWRMVSSDEDSTVVCLFSSPLRTVGQASSTWSRKQWPSPSRSRLLSLSSSESMLALAVQGWSAGIST